MSEIESFSIYSSNEEINNDGDKQKFYEPDPKVLAKLYAEIKEKKYLDLEWKFLGRLTAEEYEQENKSDQNQEMETDEMQDSKDQSKFNDFDFDDDLQENKNIAKIPLIKKKASSAPKNVTNLDKVMHDIKKYQKIDKQTKLIDEDDNV